jgi:uncharacterized protein (TIGR03084 family)
VPADPGAVVDDLAAEEEDLAAVLAALAPEDWDAATPAEGWTVRHQVAHLAEGEELAAVSLSNPDAFAERLAALLADLGATAAAAEARAAAPPAELLDRWEEARQHTLAGLRRLAPGTRVGWVTGPISRASFATARLMETWAHGQDVVDGLGIERVPTARLRHIAHLGVATRGFSFTNRGLAVPAAEVRVDLDTPDGERWTWGPEDAPEWVAGPALDFCLVVTQRRAVADTALVATGEGATRWLAIAQCFAGPPTERR